MCVRSRTCFASRRHTWVEQRDTIDEVDTRRGHGKDRSSAELSDQKSASASRTVQRSARVTRLRWLVRSLSLIAVILVMLPPTRALGLAWLAPAASPLVALASVISIRSAGWIALPGLAVAVIVAVRRRWFCRWMCPTGLLADIATHAGRQRGRSYSAPSTDRAMAGARDAGRCCARLSHVALA